MSFGFIGTGSMGGALARAAAKSGAEVLLANRTAAKAEALAAELGAAAVTNEEAARRADFLFLGVKPQLMADMLADIAPALRARKDRFVLVSMAAGLTMADIRRLAGGDWPVIHIVPNTPAAIGEGIILYAATPDVTEAELDVFLKGMSAAGRLTPLEERLMDAGSAVSGCGPAFVDLFVEALADGGVACGLPRAAALEMAAQMTAGAARLILESGQHPGVLKDQVCSPGGSTIMGVRALEDGGFRSAVFHAVMDAFEKTRSLGRS